MVLVRSSLRSVRASCSCLPAFALFRSQPGLRTLAVARFLLIAGFVAVAHLFGGKVAFRLDRCVYDQLGSTMLFGLRGGQSKARLVLWLLRKNAQLVARAEHVCICMCTRLYGLRNCISMIPHPFSAGANNWIVRCNSAWTTPPFRIVQGRYIEAPPYISVRTPGYPLPSHQHQPKALSC